MTGVADLVHYGCGVATVRDLHLVKVEAPATPRRGRPPKVGAPAKVWLGYCTACGKVRLFGRKPPEQLELAVGAPAAAGEASAPVPVL